MAFLDEYGRRELKKEMAALAAGIAVDGEMRLRLRRRDIKYLEKLSGRIVEAEAQVDMECLRRLGESVRFMQVCASRAGTGGGMLLPACGKYTRISMIAETLLASGDRSMDVAAMQYALREFDEMQGMTMSEYWAFPEAVYIAACEIYVKVARQIMNKAADHVAAARWMENGTDDALRGRSPEFFECALQLAMELEKPDLRLRLENAIARTDSNTEACVRLAQERSALAVMRLDNLMATVRAVEAADWQKVFETASRTEAELRNDPDGTYPMMSDDSRAAVRRRLSLISRRTGVGETTIARYAVNAAREAPNDDVRRSICWWLYDDCGTEELKHRLGAKVRIEKLYPDKKGYMYMFAQCVLSAGLGLLASKVCGSLWWLLPILPLSWWLVSYVLARVITRIMKPRAVLRMEYDSLPEYARTLVAVPALLNSPSRARQMCRQLEVLGCLEKDANLEFVLLGDFPDAETRMCDTDIAILEAAREEIARMNAAAGRAKYHYLHRERTFAETDGIYRGSERKRGALMALCRLAIGRSKGQFTAEGSSEDAIFGRFRYVVTLDADTKMLPGTAAKLVGAIAHTLNRARYEGLCRRGFAVMQPLVELDAVECKNSFVKLFAGAGGLNTYSGMASDMYHDLTGTGAYCGKAVIDMPAFLDCLEGRLDGGRILSHDFIEGAISGAGHINDIALFDGFPENYRKWLSRLARWTRGDWQLIPDIFRKDISALGRFRLISNLIDSLREPALLSLFVLGLWAGNAPVFALGIAAAFIVPMLMRLWGDKQAFVRGSMEVSVLPATAYKRAEAIFKALWRTFVSKRRLLDWVTSADTVGDAAGIRVACRAAAILLLPGLFDSYWIIPALALGALFVIGPSLADELEEAKADRCEQLTADGRRLLNELSRDTWRFFERYVDAAGNYLPPDNVQVDPNPGVARRTSPTNIGMYMLSCLSARELGFIGDEEYRLRITDTLNTLDKLEKWNGHIYNWYNTDTLEVLAPRYVSSVDSGNLAAALLCCSNACTDEMLAQRLRKFAEGMNFAAVYDHERKLFYIGADVEHGRLSNSHYDLLASEARILSYTSIMLSQIPIDHWRALGRPVSGDTLMSWSGTMFEYFMPALIMPSAAGSLMGNTYRGVVRAQKRFAASRGRPWGVSESGYHAFDMDMNYQYRAFGLNVLSMNGTQAQDVVAPYGACLGLMEDAAEACRNISDIQAKGWAGDCGLFEAVDFVRREPRVVKSWMSHHQGMALCAMCNALTGNVLQEYFMKKPEAQALQLLLNERAVARIKLQKTEDIQPAGILRHENSGIRRGRTGMLADTALLGGGETAVLVSARGDVVYSHRGVYAARFTGDLLRRRDTMFTEIIDADGNVSRLNSDVAKCVFAPGTVTFSMELAGIGADMKLAVSPEDGMLVKYITVTNTENRPTEVTVVDGLEMALMNMDEMRAHPAFHRLFCSTDLSVDNAVITRRRMREKGIESLALVHVASCDVCGRETDWMRLVGRGGKLNTDFAGRDGAHTDPCSALKVSVKLGPGEKRSFAFAVGLCAADDARKLAERYSALPDSERVIRLAAAFIRSAAEFAGLNDEKRILSERACAIIVDPRLRRLHTAAPAVGEKHIHGGISSVYVCVDGGGGLGVLRDAVRMHEYCRSLGFAYQLVVIYEHGNDYMQPVRDGVHEIIGASHLRDMCFALGGVNVYDGAAITEEQRNSLERGASLAFNGSTGYWQQLRRMLMQLQYSGEALQTQQTVECDFECGNNSMKYGSLEDEGFMMRVAPGNIPPAPWSNIIMADKLGMLITERGGGFIWHDNSRMRRVTCFDNDPANEGWNTMIYVTDRQGRFIRALPGDVPTGSYRVCHGLRESRFECRTKDMCLETAVFGDEENDLLVFEVCIENTSGKVQEYRLTGFVDWLMGADGGDAGFTRAWNQDNVLLASGALDVVGFLACSAPMVECCPDRNPFLGRGGVMQPDGLGKRGDGGCALAGVVSVEPDSTARVVFVLGCRNSAGEALAAASAAVKRDYAAVRTLTKRRWEDMRDSFSIYTGDVELDRLANGFILKQVIDGRVRARAGFYQAGGAFGFRDQLQDMLALLPYRPDLVRGHILNCARHQFRDGDVMHWWHPPMTGVRTHISDDMLFMPFVTCRYVTATGDEDILDESAPYLQNAEIPDGREDVYSEMQLSGEYGTLREHCLRALRRAYRRGEHGLLLMGSGDWNDGMNRVGSGGRGESVWLSMFFCVCARMFAEYAGTGIDRAWLMSAADELMESIQKYGWDGKWYIRAYDDDGEKLGSSECEECRIDLIAQAWAVFSDCPEERWASALEAAWEMLYLEDKKVLRLLTPPFGGEVSDPGYIAAYPPGVRENGGQYTHAACWYLIALAKAGDSGKVKELLNALLPVNHAQTTEDADLYRTEPYVMAADIYGEKPYSGRGGWTWYTGAAGWYLCAVRYILGYERCGNRVRLNALEGVWERPRVTIRYGNARYTLISDAAVHRMAVDGCEMDDEFVAMKDDGLDHICLFPMRQQEYYIL